MNVTPTGVTNAANLSLFMVNVAYRLQDDARQRSPAYSLLDLKADCRGSKYVEETIKMLPEKPAPVLFAKILNQVTSLGRIHLSQPSFRFAELAMVLPNGMPIGDAGGKRLLQHEVTSCNRGHKRGIQ